ncbi:MAG: SIS domain-containing protein [Actinobacteria bacterium]|nr:SIS domain-containing protein [Actinomycetota bacterium]
MAIDDAVLLDPERLISEGGSVLAAIASAGAELRTGVAETDPDAVAALAAAGRPRALVVMGAGGSSAAGEVLAACAGRGSSVPIVTTAGPGLPGWVGPLDLVVAVSASGASPETLAVVAEAGRRGCSIVGISGSGGDALQTAVAHARGLALQVGRLPQPRRARTLTWRLAAPLLLIGQALGIVEGGSGILDAVADELDVVTLQCGPGVELGANPAKDLALAAAQGYPMVWGTPGVPAVAARRASRQLAENAGLPSSSGAFPEIARTHARVLAGPWGHPDDDIFRDRVSEPEPSARPHLVLLSDDESDALSTELLLATESVAASAGLWVQRIDGGSGHPLARFARLTQPLDLASVYAAALVGADPAGSAAGLHPALGTGR